MPFVSLIIMYVPIAWKLWHPDRQLTDQPDTASNDISRMTERNRRRTTIMVIAVLLAFFVCFFPFHIYFLIQLFSENFESKPTTESSVLRVILMLNAAINPIIYNLLSENFRAAFRGIFACFLRAQPEVSSTSADTMQSIAS